MAEKETLYYEDIEVGMEIPSLVKEPTVLQIFSHSAATWNRHRVHYEKDYAVKEGHKDILVQQGLHGGFLAQMLTDWIGPTGTLKKFNYSVRNRAFPGDTLTCRGTVTGKYEKDGKALIECDITEFNQDEEKCTIGSAVLVLPRKNG